MKSRRCAKMLVLVLAVVEAVSGFLLLLLGAASILLVIGLVVSEALGPATLDIVNRFSLCIIGLGAAIFFLYYGHNILEDARGAIRYAVRYPNYVIR